MSIAESRLVKNWTDKTAAVLEGRTIARVRYITEDEMKSLYWFESGIILELDDGTLIYPSRDDEGNGPGALFTSHEALPCVPVIQPKFATTE